MDNKRGAIEDYIKAIEINTNYAEAYYNRGAIWSKPGKITDACNDWKKVLDLGILEAQTL